MYITIAEGYNAKKEINNLGIYELLDKGLS